MYIFLVTKVSWIHCVGSSRSTPRILIVGEQLLNSNLLFDIMTYVGHLSSYSGYCSFLSLINSSKNSNEKKKHIDKFKHWM